MSEREPPCGCYPSVPRDLTQVRGGGWWLAVPLGLIVALGLGLWALS